MDSLWQRLRSRKIVEWVIAYLAAGFGLLQLADVLEGPFSWSASVIRVLTVVVAFGFLAVLILSWYHGEKGHQRMQTAEIGLLVVVFAATIATSWYVAATTPAPRGAGRRPATIGADGAVPPASETGDSRLALFDPSTAAQSVAILPFANMTPDQENDYLTDGITEDIISSVGKIEGLRVISRTSVMRYRNTEKSIPEIGAELGVGVILEGSVRVQDDQVRIVAQLIDVATDSHIWTETYDRSLKDMLAVQAEVARAIADALGARLAPTVLAAGEELPNVDPEAYRQYLRGRTLAGSSSAAERAQAVVHLDSAIQIDPGFAPAYAALASLQTPIVPEVQTTVAAVAPKFDQAIITAERAVQLDPGLADAQSSLAMARAFRGRDLEGAEAAARKAIQANPNSVAARLRYAQILFSAGRREEAMKAAQAAAALDPMSTAVQTQMAEFALAAGHPDEAEAYVRKAMALDSNAVGPYSALAAIYQDQNRSADAVRELEKAATMDPDNLIVLSQLASALVAGGRQSEVRTIVSKLERQVEEGHPAQPFIAQIHMSLGEIDQAAEWIKLSVEKGRQAFFMMPPQERRTFDAMLKDPRIAAMLDSMNVQFEFHRITPDSIRPPRPPGGRGSRSGTQPGR